MREIKVYEMEGHGVYISEREFGELVKTNIGILWPKDVVHPEYYQVLAEVETYAEAVDLQDWYRENFLR